MPAHQVLPLMGYILEASYSTSAIQITKVRVLANQNTEIYEQALEL